MTVAGCVEFLPVDLPLCICTLSDSTALTAPAASFYIFSSVSLSLCVCSIVVLICVGSLARTGC